MVIWIHDAGGVATTYLISINATGYSPAMVTSTAGVTSYTYTFTNLNSDQVYKVTVMASNCAGTSASDSYTEGRGCMLSAILIPYAHAALSIFIAACIHKCSLLTTCK